MFTDVGYLMQLAPVICRDHNTLTIIWIRMRRGAELSRTAAAPIRVNHNVIYTTFSNGCLGSHIDEERSEMRYVMRIARLRESSKFWTHIALQAFAGSMPLWVSANPLRLLIHVYMYSGDGLLLLLSFVDCDEAYIRLCRVYISAVELFMVLT